MGDHSGQQQESDSVDDKTLNTTPAPTVEAGVAPASAPGNESPMTNDQKPDKHWPTTDLGFIPIPRRLRYHPDNPPFHFGLVLNISFGFASTFSKH